MRRQQQPLLLVLLLALSSTGCMTTILLDVTQEKMELDDARKDTLAIKEWTTAPAGTRLLVKLKNQTLLRGKTLGISNPDTLFLEVPPERQSLFARNETRAIATNRIEDVIRFKRDKIPRTLATMVGLTFDAGLLIFLYYIFTFHPGPLYGA